MSLVIIGGNECMKNKYEVLCKENGYKAKVFLDFNSGIKGKIGSPDVMILFTNTVSHKMVKYALNKIDSSTKVIRSHTSSIASLKTILDTVA